MKRFWDKVRVGREDECWIWLEGHNGHGYGIFWLNGRNFGAHRIAYEMCVGPIPEGLCLDHLCRNRACVNPAHLEPVTLGENVLRGIGTSAQNKRKTHCQHGHPYAGDNLKIDRRGRRNCRICRNVSKVLYERRVYVPKARVQKGPCKIAGCDRKARARGLCETHYYREKSAGTLHLHGKREAQK